MNEENKQETNQVPNPEPVVANEKEQPIKQEEVPTTVVANPTPQEPVPASKVEDSSSTKPPKKGGNFKYIMTIFLFIGLFAMIFFLPDITESIKEFTSSKEKENIEPVTPVESGVMSCTLTKEGEGHETTAIVRFQYKDKKLKSTVTETTVVLEKDVTGEDATFLGNKQADCEHLKEVVEGVEGFDTSCVQGEKMQTTTETVDYETLDREAISENIAEFEGTAPEFQLDQDIEELKSIMESSGYACEQS